MTIAPRSETSGDHIGIMLAWCGDKIFQHTALRRAANADDADFLGVLREFFNSVPQGPAAAESVARSLASLANVFKCKFGGRDVEAVEERRGIRLLPDQRRCLQVLNESDSHVICIPSLAGTGKTTLVSVMLEVLLPSIEGTTEAAVLMVPSRVLRDELLMSLEGIFATEEDFGTKVL
ncbi:MAG: DEAD/DEAH box helicase family protein, partial [bacterium]|nr:DEAD/DEAH box helicase family protein [bacterium]